MGERSKSELGLLQGSATTETNASPPTNIALTLRPHHFRLAIVREVFIGIKDPLIAARNLTANLRKFALKYGDPIGYFEDVLGKDYEGWKTLQRDLGVFFTKLQQLPNDDFIEISLDPDGICRSCLIGRHCNATNFKHPNTSRTAPLIRESREEEAFTHINNILQNKGYQQDRDYFVFPHNYLFQDFHGHSFPEPVETTPHTIPFSSLVAQTRTLRDISPYIRESSL